MFTRVALAIFFISVVAGCATNSKKHAARTQPVITQKSYQQETYSQDYDLLPDDGCEAPEQKTYSVTAEQLSPKQIQQALKNAGYYDGPVDGKIGPKTKAAIIKFQKANGLKPDGVVGKRTSAGLNRHL